MLKAIFNWFTGRPVPGTEAPPVQPEAAPYKVDAPETVRVHQPEPARCGCGRSQSGFCVGLHKLTAEEWAVHADNPRRVPEKKPAVKAKTARAQRAPATMTAAEKPKKAPAKATAKKPRKPQQ